MATEQASSSAPQPGPAETAPLVVNLRVISPSRGVPTPITYADLPAATTVRVLKEKLRGELEASTPSDVRLRLIHRGRVLSSDEATLEDVLGATAVSSARACSPIPSRPPSRRTLSVRC